MKIKSWTFVMILLFAALSTIYMPYFEAAYAADNKEEEIKDNMNKEIDRRLNELDLSEFEIFSAAGRRKPERRMAKLKRYY